MLCSFHAIVPLLEGNRSFAEPRQAIIARTPVLAERELAKIAVLTAAMADGLQARGDSQCLAAIAAHTAMGAFTYATVAWLADPQLSLNDQLIEAAATLHKINGTG